MEKDLFEEAVKSCGERCAMIADIAAIRKNAEYIVRKTGKKLIAVVKADAYGHGLTEVVHALDKLAALYAVATAEEALQVADCGKKALILSPVPDGELKKLKGKDISVCVENEKSAADAAKSGVPVHVAVDTGMHRYGVDWHDIGRLLSICDTQGLDVKGLFTHFAKADADETEDMLTQHRRFEGVVNVLGKRRFEYIHSANSAAALRISPSGNAVRAGLALYGINPSFCNAPLCEVSRFYARILCIRLLRDGESIGYGGAYVASGVRRIAVIGAGYADGLPYTMKKYGSVLVNGKYCSIVGNVCMDCAFVDITYARADEGDYVCVFGGEGEVSYKAAARKTDLIPYSIMTGITHRVKRLYIKLCCP